MKVNKERIHHPDQSLRCMRFVLQAFGLERHRHSHLELTWIEQGAGVRFLGDSAAPFTSGDLVLVGSNVPHTWISAAVQADTPCIVSMVQFSPELFSQLAVPELGSLQPLMQWAARGLQISGLTHARVTQRLQEMQGLPALGQLEGLIGILGYLNIAGEDLRPIANPGVAAPRTAGQLSRIDRVLQWVHLHLSEEFAIADAAREAHVSTASFSRFFKRETGKTFTDYVNDVRCAKACVLLRESSQPIAGIAAACGFATSSHFNRQFLSRFGNSPRRYRQPSGS
jgi:AraC-like DNA-binding protein